MYEVEVVIDNKVVTFDVFAHDDIKARKITEQYLPKCRILRCGRGKGESTNRVLNYSNKA